MSGAGKFTKALGDLESLGRLKLSVRRASILLRRIYTDISGLSEPGTPQAVGAERVEPFQVARGALLAAAFMMTLPATMIVLSHLLRPLLNHRTNMVLGILYTLVMLVAMLPGGWMFYLLLGGIEIALTVTIVWFARTGAAREFREIAILTPA